MIRSMDQFKDIEPYTDNDVRPTLKRLLKDNEFIRAMAKLKFPRSAKLVPGLVVPLVRLGLRWETAGVNSVDGLQNVIEKYLNRVIRRTTNRLTYSGLERLSKDNHCLFVSNHRDIAMDPAFINYALYHNGFNTSRIAIGDNLLSKPYVSDLMRLNKCFIVTRSPLAPRAAFAAYKKLSTYIRRSISKDNSHIWIAQREGRAKDGCDRTEPAIIKMLAMSQRKEESFSDCINDLHIVPISISYEYDPCDAAKARELCEVEQRGRYEKRKHEDVEAIAAGISGNKGHVHVAFGSMIQGDFENADQVAAEVDQQIVENYILHPSNFFAYRALFGIPPKGDFLAPLPPFDDALKQQEAAFLARVHRYPYELQEMVLKMYANPVLSKAELKGWLKPLK